MSGHVYGSPGVPGDIAIRQLIEHVGITEERALELIAVAGAHERPKLTTIEELADARPAVFYYAGRLIADAARAEFGAPSGVPAGFLLGLDAGDLALNVTQLETYPRELLDELPTIELRRAAALIWLASHRLRNFHARLAAILRGRGDPGYTEDRAGPWAGSRPIGRPGDPACRDPQTPPASPSPSLSPSASAPSSPPQLFSPPTPPRSR